MKLDVVSVLLVLFSIFFALSMGGAGFSPSLSAALGAKQLRRWPALVLFAICVGIGALLIGGNVAKTLGGRFVFRAVPVQEQMEPRRSSPDHRPRLKRSGTPSSADAL